MYYSISEESNVLLRSLFSVIQMQLCESKVINVQRKTQCYQFCDFLRFLASSVGIERKNWICHSRLPAACNFLAQENLETVLRKERGTKNFCVYVQP